MILDHQLYDTVQDPEPVKSGLPLTIGPWRNRWDRNHPGNKPQKVFANLGPVDQEHYPYGERATHDGHTPPPWALDGPVQAAIVCAPHTRRLAIEIDGAAAFAATELGRLVSPADAYSTRDSHFHVTVDMRGVEPDDWPKQGPLYGDADIGHVKSAGFIPLAGSIHYTGEPYAATGRGDIPCTPELLAAMVKAAGGTGVRDRTGAKTARDGGDGRPMCPPVLAFIRRGAIRIDAGEDAKGRTGSRHNCFRDLIFEAVRLGRVEGHAGTAVALAALETRWNLDAPGREQEFARMEDGANGVLAGKSKSRGLPTLTGSTAAADTPYSSADQGERCFCDQHELVPAHYEPLSSAHAVRRKLDAETMGWSEGSPDWSPEHHPAWGTYVRLMYAASASQLAFTARVKIPGSATDAEIALLASERLLDLADPGYVTLLADEVPAAEFVHCRWCGKDHEASEFAGAPLDDCCPLSGKQLGMGNQVLRIRAAYGGEALTARQMVRLMNSYAYREQFGLTECRYASVKGVLAAQVKLKKSGQLELLRAAIRVRYRHCWHLVEPAVYRATAPHADASRTAALIALIAPRRAGQAQPPPRAARQPGPEEFMTGAA